MRTVFKTSYGADIGLFRHGGDVFWYGLLALIMIALPYLLGEFFLGEEINVLIWALAGLGLMSGCSGMAATSSGTGCSRSS
jgi:branched-chain amino acid transport system permease protein